MVKRSLLILTLLAPACGKEPAAAPEPAKAKPAGGPAQPVAAVATNARRGPEQVAYSLVDNRLAAHLTVGGGLVVPAGSAGFAKYVRIGNQLKDKHRSWELRQQDGSVRVARMTGKTASVFVPLTAAQAAQGHVRMRVKLKDDGTLTLRVNGGEKKELHKKVEKGWQTLDLDVSGQLVAGENTLELYVKSSDTAFAWFHVGATTPIGDEDNLAVYDGAQQGLAWPRGGILSYYVLAPAKARLVGDVPDAACAVRVAVAADDGATVTGKLSGVGSAVELGALAGKPVRLDLEVTGCPGAVVRGPALVVPSAPPALAARGPAPKHVLFVIMDSLRADKVKPWNPKARAEVPVFQKLAETGTVFQHHYVQGTESQVSHAAMWTAMYLAKHRASEMSHKLADKWTTLDEVGKQANLFTVGVSANGYIRPTRGFGPKWDRFKNHILEGGGLRGADVVKAGIEQLGARKDKPWLMYLGLIDTHVTWRAKQPWLDRYDPGYKGRFAKEFGDDGPTGFATDLNDAEKEHVRALYDSNVSYQDDQLGKLLEQLQAWGIRDQTMVIVTADHGDELWEDGKTVGHARTPRETVVRVPLLIHYPPLFPAGAVVNGTEGIDILPTIADALGVAQDAEWQGTSLVPLARGAVVASQLAVASQYENFHAGRIGNWKIRIAGGKDPTLFDLASDPAERKDRWGDKSAAIAARVLLDPMWLMRQWNVEWKKAAWGNPAAVSPQFVATVGE